ncbi:MAG: hypothetical protein HY060_17160 [Proteobacteria bacterium]|nr:hypothetical protein [Pseudomonadota bacterium]
MAEIVDFPGTARPWRITPDVVAALRAGADTLAHNSALLRRYGAALADQSAALRVAKDALDLQRRRACEIVVLSQAIERAIDAGDVAAMLALKERVIALSGQLTRDGAPSQIDAAD